MKEPYYLRNINMLLILSIFSLTILYIIQIHSPLRLTPDVIVYLGMAESASNGHGFIFHGQTYYPPGYPALLAMLICNDLGHPSYFIGINLCFLIIGHINALYINIKLFNFSKTELLLILFLSLLSFVYIIHVPFPLSDVVFYGVSMAALACLTNVEKGKYGLIFAFLCILLVLASIEIRNIGIALLPPVIYKISQLFNVFPKKLIGFLPSRSNYFFNYIIIYLLFLILLIIFIIYNNYTKESFNLINSDVGSTKIDIEILKYRFTEFGELIINFPFSRVNNKLSTILIVIGVIGSVVTGYGIYQRIGNLSVLDAYVIIFLFIIFLWPYPDVRFWLPILPFIICYAVIGLKSLINLQYYRILVNIYLMVFILSGLVVFAYTTRLSFSGQNFPEVMRDKSYYLEYKIAFSDVPPPDNRLVNGDAIHMLKKFNGKN